MYSYLIGLNNHMYSALRLEKEREQERPYTINKIIIIVYSSLEKWYFRTVWSTYMCTYTKKSKRQMIHMPNLESWEWGLFMYMYVHVRSICTHSYKHIRTMYMYASLHTCTWDCLECVCSTILLHAQDYYSKGEYVLRQGATGDTFFIINAGTVSKV